jgi:hypothetical protein
VQQPGSLIDGALERIVLRSSLVACRSHCRTMADAVRPVDHLPCVARNGNVSTSLIDLTKSSDAR